MKKIVATSILIFVFQSLILGQSISLGPEMKNLKNSYGAEILGKDEDGFYVQRLTYTKNISIFSLKLKYNYVLESYDMNMEIINSVPKPEDKKEARVITEQLTNLMLKDKLYVFNTITDLNEKTYSLEIDEIDKTSLFPLDEPKKLAEISYEEGSKRNKGGFNLSVSNDSSKILVYSIFPYEKGQMQKFKLQVYDNKINELWSNDVELPYNEELFDVVDLEVGNDGNVYLLGKVYEEKHREKKRGEVNYQYHIIYYEKDNLSGVDTEIDSKSKFFNEISMSVNNKNQVICVGLYTSDINAVSEGTFYLRLNSKTHKNEVITFKEFSELLEDNGTDSERKKKRKQDKLYKDYFFRNIIQKEDGGIIVVAEQYYVVVKTTTSTSSSGHTTTRTTYYYHYDNILVLNIDKNGKFIWQKIIPKKQVSVNDLGYYLSFTLATKGEDLYFIYNTTIYKKNRSGKETSRFKRKNYMKNLSIYKLDKNGELSEKTDLLDRKADKIMMVPKNGMQVSENEILMFGKLGRINRFALINIE